MKRTLLFIPSTGKSVEITEEKIVLSIVDNCDKDPFETGESQQIVLEYQTSKDIVVLDECGFYHDALDKLKELTELFNSEFSKRGI